MSKLYFFEGIDGSGKATQVAKCAKYLESQGAQVKTLTYPDYDRPLGQLIERFLKKEFDLTPEIQFLLYATDMLKDKEQILAWLREGKTVLVNRYLTSTTAYQTALGFPLEKARTFVQLFDVPRPAKIFYLKISPETSVRRKINQKVELDRFESKEALQQQFATSFEQLIDQQFLGSWAVIDGEKGTDEVFEQIRPQL